MRRATEAATTTTTTTDERLTDDVRSRVFFTTRAGPHKSRECLPLCLILRNRLKYALTYKEVTTILMQRCVKVDGKIRLDKCYPCGIMGTLFFVAIYRRGRVGRRRATSDARMGRWRQKTLAGRDARLEEEALRWNIHPTIARRGTGFEQLTDDCVFSSSFYFAQTSSPLRRATNTSA